MTPRLELTAIRKTYGDVLANDDISLRVLPGEIHAVLGENGAGKSTLMKIIDGVVTPDAGTIRWNGAVVDIASPAAARALGISMVFQHFSLFETLTVAENIALAMPERLSRNALAARIRDVAQKHALPLDPDRHVYTMSAGERQRVEIVRCLLQKPALLILDEPTSVLAPTALPALFATLRQIAADGCSILYISHKLEEIRALCDRATVLRGGRVSGECDPRATSAHDLARLMIGSDLPAPSHRASRPSAQALLQVRGLTLAADEPHGTDLHGVSFDVHAGEIVGIAGISGNGQRELFAALSGERSTARPEDVVIAGRAVGMQDARQRRGAGLAAIPEERQGRGAVPEMTLTDNTLLTMQPKGRRGILDRRAAHDRAAAIVRDAGVKARGPEAIASTLSGGNLQKFIVAREMQQRPAVLLAAQPTWGVDVAASAQIRQTLLDLRDSGAAIVVISDDLDELFAIADRIAVMSSGRLGPALPVGETTPEAIGLAMGTAAPDGVPSARAAAGFTA